MFGLPKDVDLSGLVGMSVVQIAFGLFQTQIRLEAGVISIEGTVSLREAPETPLEASAQLLSLLGAEVSSASRKEPGDLQLEFSNGSHLVVHDSNPTTESYSVETKAGLIVV